MPQSEYSADITTVCAGGIGLLTKMLLLQDADAELAAVDALAVVTTANYHNC